MKPLLFLSVLILNINTLVFSQQEHQKNYFSVSTAIFDVLQETKPSLEGRFEFRYNSVGWVIKPYSGFMTNTDGAFNLYAGIFKDFSIGSFLVFTTSFAPGIYYKNKSKDLYFLLEFRSGIELAVKFENDFKVGVSFYHVSNASLGKLNPGVESLALTYYIPL
jgi:lipid A 3-O-deacylase